MPWSATQRSGPFTVCRPADVCLRAALLAGLLVAPSVSLRAEAFIAPHDPHRATTIQATLGQATPGPSTPAPSTPTPPAAPQPAAPAPSGQAPAQPPRPGTPGAETPERRRVRIEAVNFTGVTAVDKGDLAAALATKASAWLPWGAKHYFSRTDLQLDLRRIRAFYADRGYPRARVATFDVVVAKDRQSMSVTFHIEEGQAVRIASLAYLGFDVLPEAVRTELTSNTHIEPGTTRTRARLNDAREAAENALKEQGYPYAHVSVLEGAGREPMTVAVTLAAEPGVPAKFGPVTIVGNKTVGEHVITRQLAFGQGDSFKLSRVLESQRRLYNLELFQYVNFGVPDLASQPTEVPVTATLTEGKHRKVQFGVGYGTEEKARGTLNWRHINFLGGARTLGVETKWSSLDRGVRVNVVEPYFLSPSYRFEASVQQWYANEPAYALLTRGGRAGIRREIVRRDAYGRRRSATRVGLSLIDEYERYTISEQALADPTFRDELIAVGLDPETNEGRGTLVAVGLDLTHDTTDTLLDAQRGYVAALHVEQAFQAIGGDWSYLEATFDGRHYWRIAPWGLLASRVRFGSIRQTGPAITSGPSDDIAHQTGVPFFKRYFLGGATSLRGWGRYEVSPLNSEGFPIGGLSQLELTSELRFPVRGPLTGVLFAEGGTVSEASWDFPVADLNYDAGAGLRYLTPIGPVRFDFGYQITPIPGLIIDGQLQERQWRLHFSVGQAF